MPTQEEVFTELIVGAKNAGNEASLQWLGRRSVHDQVVLTEKLNAAYEIIRQIKDGEATQDQISKNEDGSFELMPPPTPIPSSNGKKESLAAKEPVTV